MPEGAPWDVSGLSVVLGGSALVSGGVGGLIEGWLLEHRHVPGVLSMLVPRAATTGAAAGPCG
jgi:hypothetical protein